MESLVSFFIDLFGGVSKEVIIFIISQLPILELRGGMVAAALLKVEFVRGLVICIFGNILPIPIVLLFLKKVLDWLEKWGFTKKIVIWLEKKVDKNRDTIDKYGYWGLALFVGIPLPGTGAWTGALLAVLLGMNRKKSFVFIGIGVLLASFIMSVVSYGILGNLIG